MLKLDVKVMISDEGFTMATGRVRLHIGICFQRLFSCGKGFWWLEVLFCGEGCCISPVNILNFIIKGCAIEITVSCVSIVLENWNS